MLIDLVVSKKVCTFAPLKRNILSNLIFYHILTKAGMKQPHIISKKESDEKEWIFQEVIITMRSS